MPWHSVMRCRHTSVCSPLTTSPANTWSGIRVPMAIACRAGTTSAWFFGDDPTTLGRYAWFTGNSGDRVHPIGEREANPWGLHDMIGNVWEWCWDWYDTYLPGMVCDPPGLKDGLCRTRRGGSAWIDPCDLRSACRDWD